MLIPHKGHTDTIQVYSVTVMTHVKALQAGHSSQGTSEPITLVLLSALLLALHLVVLSALQSPKDLKLYTTNRLECSTANSTPLSTPFGTAFSTPFSTRDLHINEVSSAKRSANLNNWRTPNGTPNGTVFSTPKDLKLNTTNSTPLECSTTNITPTNGVLFGVLHSLASFDTRNNTRNSTNMSTASPYIRIL